MFVEVCVIGGGPAGSTIAHRLARRDYDVLLVEREAFPRPHVGESLPSNVVGLLDELGVRDEVEGAGFLRPSRALVAWGGVTRFRADLADGFQVDRGRFDAILLRAAERAGARVWQPARARRITRRGFRDWLLELQTNDGPRTVECQFVVDAAGSRGCLAGRHERLAPATIALYAYWQGVGLGGPETRVEAGEEQWYWGAPLPNGLVNATVFVDPVRCRALGAAGLSSTYLHLLAQSRLLTTCRGGQMATPVATCVASLSRSREPVGDDWIKVGEAALADDPLSSQGVLTALSGGLQAGAVVHTLLSRPSRAAAALAFYRERIESTARRHAARTAELYRDQAEVTPNQFWLTRAAAGTQAAAHAEVKRAARLDCRFSLSLSDEVEWREVPVLVDEFVDVQIALHHPSLPAAVAWLEGLRVADLLRDVDGEANAWELVERWSNRLPTRRAERVVEWFWQHGILVTAKGATTQPQFESASLASEIHDLNPSDWSTRSWLK